MDISALQNGSDIRGVAIKADKEINLTQEAVTAIGRSFAKWLSNSVKKNDGLRVAIGTDSRISGGDIAQWFANGLEDMGVVTFMTGLSSTPAMFMTTVTEGFMMDGAAMITASHLPFDRNGIKLFTAKGGLEKGDIKAILALAGDGVEVTGKRGMRKQLAFMPVYAKQLRDKIIAGADAGDKPLSGLHIVVDAGNGAGGFYVKDVLVPLGADTTGSLYLDPDGRFPNHAPNPENEAAMQSITQAVLASKADFGIIFDTDVDRAGAVLSDGRELNRNLLIAMMSAILLKEHPGTAIVTDSITSTGLAEFIKSKGGIHERFKRGYRNVINEAVRLNSIGQDCQMAMETSGHGALKENWFLDDGAYLVTRLLIELVKARKCGHGLGELIAGLREPVESREVRMGITEDDFKAYGEKVINAVTERVEKLPGFTVAPDNREGIRCSADKAHGDGWFLLRLSLHDPVMPLNIESDSEGGVAVILEAVKSLIADFDGLTKEFYWGHKWEPRAK